MAFQDVPPNPDITDETGGYWVDAISAIQAWAEVDFSQLDLGQPIGFVDTGIDNTVPSLGAKAEPVLQCRQFWACEDEKPHGTSVAALAAGRGDDGVGSTGLAWDSRINMYDVTNGDPEGATAEQVADGLISLMNIGIRVINVSYGPCLVEGQEKNSANFLQMARNFRSGLRDALDAADFYDVLIVFAAGNDGHGDHCEEMISNEDNPVTFRNDNQLLNVTDAEFAELWNEHALLIGSSDSSNDLAAHTRYGDLIDILAPGEDVLIDFNDTTTVTTGTSLAAPLVAGTAALILHEQPDLSASQVKDIIKGTATHFDGPSQVPAPGLVRRYILNAYEAILRAREFTCSNGTCTDAQCPQDADCSAVECGPDPVCGIVCGACDSPPDDFCADANTLTSYQTPGTCDGGTCTYTTVDTNCPNGCNEILGACHDCSNICSPEGTTECTGGEIRVCEADEFGCLSWGTFTPCPEGFCGDAISCGNCNNLCPAGGVTECTSGELRTCEADLNGCLDWGIPAPCAEGFCGDAQSCGNCNHECDVVGAICNGDVLETCSADVNGCRVFSTQICEYGCSAGACNVSTVAAAEVTSPTQCEVLATTDSAVLEFTVTDLTGIDHFTFDVKEVTDCNQEPAGGSIPGYPTTGIAETPKTYTLQLLSPNQWYKYSIESTATAGYQSINTVGWFRTAQEPGVAHHLAFGTPPQATVQVDQLWQPFTIRIEDEFNGLVDTASDSVSVILATGNGTLSGTMTVNAIGGIATFDDLLYDLPEAIVLDFTSGVLLGIQGVGVTVTSEPVAMDWAAIPGGTFMMGSDTGDANEQPVHQVTVPHFEMNRTEVTVAQFQACVDAGVCAEPITGGDSNWGVAGRENHPLNRVSWFEAVDFCTWVGGRLPSEAEWEYAARGGGEDITYPWGDQAPTCTYAVMNEGVPGCGLDSTWPVCSKTAGNTAQGLCDMAGNIWEWVHDWYHSDYNGAPSDGSAWEDPIGSNRVLRGGKFNSSAHSLRAAYRYSNDPSLRFYLIGFRCARDVDTGLEWIQIPGGTFMMGSDAGASYEQPVHQVNVQDFDILNTEVTVTQYQVCVDAGGCTEPDDYTVNSYCNWQQAGREDHPVNCADWQQAVDFCTWVGGRLPSEAEWEYAARSGGQNITYPWGENPASCTYAVMDEGSGYGCGLDSTWPVCSKTAGNTAQGLCDMAGNIWEWVQDWFHVDYNGAPSDGSAWENPIGSSRVFRGGSFDYDGFNLRASIRNADVQSSRYAFLGFRCAR